MCSEQIGRTEICCEGDDGLHRWVMCTKQEHAELLFQIITGFTPLVVGGAIPGEYHIPAFICWMCKREALSIGPLQLSKRGKQDLSWYLCYLKSCSSQAGSRMSLRHFTSLRCAVSKSLQGGLPPHCSFFQWVWYQHNWAHGEEKRREKLY